MIINYPNNYDTDISASFIEIDNPSNSDCQSFPIKLSFTVFLTILCQPKSPLSGNLKKKRYIQNFVILSRKRIGVVLAT